MYAYAGGVSLWRHGGAIDDAYTTTRGPVHPNRDPAGVSAPGVDVTANGLGGSVPYTRFSGTVSDRNSAFRSVSNRAESYGDAESVACAACSDTVTS